MLHILRDKDGWVAAALHQGVFDREEGTFALHKPLLKSSRRLHTAKTVLPDASMK